MNYGAIPLNHLYEVSYDTASFKKFASFELQIDFFIVIN